MRSAEIKSRFTDYFERNGHTVVPSASLILDDPTLLFVNAGMVPFKPYLQGIETPPYPRATSVQKCLRTLDIDEVGKTARHGTFFQMAGNFSFGDYFKEGAITAAWELLTNSQDDGGYGFAPDRLWPTVYRDDDEAFGIWNKLIGVPEERIQRRGMADNYWSMGVPGPCGPCSEIFFDRGPEYGPDGGPIVDEERFLEVWNLVFMQFERGPGPGKDGWPILGELPKKNIDTGMGVERMAYLLQGKQNLYEIDEVFPVLERAAELTGTAYGSDGGADVRLRVVADHVRSAMMIMADGVTPSNEGRGYVLRRLLRRVIRSVRLLGYPGASLPELLPASRDAMAPSYPEVATDFERISTYAYAEEETFAQTLRAGTAILDTAVRETKQRGGGTLPGAQAFQLHDTYGFPIDLTLEMAGEQGLTVDEDGFRALMAEQRQRAKADAQSRKGGGGAGVSAAAYRELRARGATDFIAHSALESESTVVGLVRDGELVPGATEGEVVELVLDVTPFYAESGGQDSDAGHLTGDGLELEVVDVQRPIKGLVVHTVRVVSGEVAAGRTVHAQVDREWRLGACQAHSGTHVVHAALRQVLGPTALQAGSYNRPGYLRLDFSWPQQLSTETRSEVEEVANLAIRSDLPVQAFFTTLPEARRIGALALFGETYDEEVRVVEIGGEWSRELCGGTHVRHSSQVGPLAITSEASVGAGMRRVEALVGHDFFGYLRRERALVDGLTQTLRVPADQVPERVQSLIDRLRTAEKELDRLRAESVLAGAGALAAAARDVGGVAVVANEVPGGLGGGELRTLVLDVRGRLSPDRAGVVALVSRADGKVAFTVATNEAARLRGLSAGDVVKAMAPSVGGRGGGRDDVAQGGGTEPDGIPEALLLVEHVIGQRTA
ncbi:MAG TPA: alanine--tRNA ligase [Mycobacteriales bacterium]|jgi:alanyl-tRNA synthetase|nr:alanine--tRNA ligase [Mycobacteriales bacterium]